MESLTLFSEFTASGPAVVVYARGASCPFCLRQLSDYAERYADFKRSGVEVVALSPESPRKARRMRTGLKLPFTLLSDSHFVAAHTFGLMDSRSQERPLRPRSSSTRKGVSGCPAQSGGEMSFCTRRSRLCARLETAGPSWRRFRRHDIDSDSGSRKAQGRLSLGARSCEYGCRPDQPIGWLLTLRRVAARQPPQQAHNPVTLLRHRRDLALRHYTGLRIQSADTSFRRLKISCRVFDSLPAHHIRLNFLQGFI